MNYIYVYIDKKNFENVLKYGMKLSEYANKLIEIAGIKKAGITGFLSPLDSELYFDNNFSCIKISTKNLNCTIYNQICENSEFLKEFSCDITNYAPGKYEKPIVFINTTILPENISSYNKELDVPLIIENSQEYYYEKAIYDMLDSNNFSKYELYQMLLILGEQKKIFKTKQEGKLKIYEDSISEKKYTKKSNF